MWYNVDIFFIIEIVHLLHCLLKCLFPTTNTTSFIFNILFMIKQNLSEEINKADFMNILMKMKFPKWPAPFNQIPTRRSRNYIKTICRRNSIEYSQKEWTSKTFLENTYNYTCLCSFLVREKLPTTR